MGSGGTSKTLTGVGVSPSTASIVAGSSQQLTATATYSDGSSSNITSTANWASGNTSLATINASGMVTGIAAGSVAVTASMNSLSGSATLTVTAVAKTLQSITVSPANPSISAGANQQFTATATYSDNSTADVTSTVSWNSGSSSVATIASAGLATAVASGSSTITASLNGVSGTAILTVTAAAKTLQSIAVSPANPSISAGATQQFIATATYSDNSTANVTSTVSWSSGTTLVATITSAGLATAVVAGSSTITASLSGVSGTANLTVTAVAKTLQSIAVSPANPSISVDATQQFTATATYSDNSTANVTSTVSWSSGTTSFATITSGGLATAVTAGSSTITASLNGVSGTATLTVTAKTVTGISISPNPASFAMGATQQFTATATYSDSSTANVTSTVTWLAANEDVATIASGGLASGVASGSTAIAASFSGKSGDATLNVTIAPGTAVNISTLHVDNNRSGLNAGEKSLTPANVTATTFGKLFSYALDGYAYGEPLLVANVTIGGNVHNVLYVATENDSVYAFDADNYGDGTPLWHVSLLQGNEAPIPGPINPYEGVTSTPVIDLSSNTMYVVSTEVAPNHAATFRLNALDITTGAQKLGGPATIRASVPGTNSTSVSEVVSLTTACIQRSALLLVNGTVYMGFSSCHSGWLLAYDAQTLAQTGVFNSSPNLDGEGAYASAGGIWMGSGGPVADSAGNIYVSTGNGPWDGQTAWSDSVLKFNAQLQMEDYFTAADYQYMFCNDGDLAGGGIMLLPGTTDLLAGGKTGKMYMVSTANLGQEQANDAGATQTLWFDSDVIPLHSASCTDAAGTHTTQEDSSEIYGTPAYFNGSVYLGVVPTSPTAKGLTRQFIYSGGMLTPSTYTSDAIQEYTRGTTPFISADGTTNGILWIIDEGQPLQNTGTGVPTSAILRAYDASNLNDERYNSSMNPGDVPGYGIKFTSPVVANGKVYISTAHDDVTIANPQGEIDVYGLK
jgi:uncharacterized protein YjdB